MSCPAESHTLDKFEKKEKKAIYENSSNAPNYVSGIKIIKAVKLYSSKESSDTKMKLEEILGQAITENMFTDSAWGGCNNKCDCQKVSRKFIVESDGGPSLVSSHYGGYSGGCQHSYCACDTHTCACDPKCRCESDCGCDNHEPCTGDCNHDPYN